MKLLTMGEYYVWYCDWCDSRNLTPWTSTVTGKVSCGGCHKEHPVARKTAEINGHFAAASAPAVSA
jgi:hypothetical protein